MAASFDPVELLSLAMVESLTGALVAGEREAFVFYLLGHPHHALSLDPPVSGLTAVEQVGAMARRGLPTRWRSDEPLGGGRSLADTAHADVVLALRHGLEVPGPGPDATGLIGAARKMVASRLHRHGAGIEAQLATATTVAEALAVARGLRHLTVRGIGGATLDRLAADLESLFRD
ncbi:MAG: hypothetical protein ACYDGR_00610 [Candidatus Dormibacteria bacterium]